MGTANLVWFLLIGLAAGWLAGRVVRGGGYGLVGDLIIGVIGALLSSPPSLAPRSCSTSSG